MWVAVRLALVGGDGGIVVEDEATGERRECPPWAPTPHGEIVGNPATPLERLLAEDAPEWAGADVFAPGGEAGNVVPLPPRTVAAAPLADPLDADALPDVDAAMRLFGSLCPGLSSAALGAVREEIERAGASRAVVEELARTIAAPRKEREKGA